MRRKQDVSRAAAKRRRRERVEAHETTCSRGYFDDSGPHWRSGTRTAVEEMAANQKPHEDIYADSVDDEAAWHANGTPLVPRSKVPRSPTESPGPPDDDGAGFLATARPLDEIDEGWSVLARRHLCEHGNVVVQDPYGVWADIISSARGIGGGRGATE